ncbi:hypothetical protein [Pseudomonas chlororaphis]|uniref:hypothetical protein n=1 Tax=Pseudomonas chlororaphis TaxID=587753 RepID=UPI0020A0DEC0|nr:hypothetical protein [Pseudomonas chlororaphis]MCP1478185.1 hypothetical protein [Pseudomonas chlororaphis]MCP1595463.1 hypothetical protein [Pseudomonas chlororaphis]WDG52751.1 hypothetical protein PUP76_23225 [Pseudomonas chlororaphis]WDH33047.1 hypothetical protein PUP62_19580 [Pseudomonas chlororaphis]WDH39129.1 hypothetical protein PUP51_19575 [Pseudomonas chlororaphis]
MGKRFEEAFRKLGEAYGGIENFHLEYISKRKAFDEAWDQDPVVKGRILRSHIFAEHFFNKYLKECLGKNKAEIDGLNFSGKIDVLARSKSPLKKLLPQIRRFNYVRNKLSHNLKSTVTESDGKYLERSTEFESCLRAWSPLYPDRTPIDTFDAFSNFLAHKFDEETNPNKHFIKNVLAAIGQDAADAYFGRES